VDYSWDEEKAASNLEKYGVTFEEAASVFDDPLYVDSMIRIIRWTNIDISSSGVRMLIVY
jgi:uncharacterized DUF497 family protein